MYPKLISKKLPGPLSKKMIERDKEVMSPSYTRDYPFVMQKGKGAMAYDLDGNIFLDFAAGIAVCSTGHSHLKVVKAISEQAKKFLHMSGTDFYYQVQIELAERLSKKTPMQGKKKAFWTNSGAEAVEAAMKLARYRTKRPNYIAFIGAFHGRTMGALSLTCSKGIQKKYFFPLLPQVYHVPYPYCFRCPFNLKYPSCSNYCLKFIEDQVFKKSLDPETIAAIFVEPIQGEGGYIVPPQSFIKELRQICDKYGILFVADEVQSGMGRTGKLFAIEHFDVSPDIVCLAKGIASGMPLGGIIATDKNMDWPPGTHASTFGGNPVSCAAALATLDLLEEKYIKNAEVVGSYMIKSLKELQEKVSCIGDVRGLGLMIGAEIVKDRETLEPDPDFKNKIIHSLYEKGILVLGCGLNTIRFSPPLIITKKQVDFVIDTLYSILKNNGC